MSLISARQLVGKTLYLKKPSRFFRLSDVISQGAKAKPVSNTLKPGYFFAMDSYLAPTEQNTKYGFTTAKRNDYYITWYGNDGKPYAIIFQNDLFDLSKLKEQGVKTVTDELKEEKDLKSNWIDDLLKGVGKEAKNILYIGIAIWGVGYLFPKLKR